MNHSPDMRSFLLPSLLVFLVGVQLGYGQLKYGIHTGIGISNMSDINADIPGLDMNSYQATLSFLAGAFGEVKLSKRFDLYAELNYENRGADNTRFHFLSFPLQLKYSFKNNISVQIGPQFNYLVSKSSDILSNEWLDQSFDKDLDVGINLGVTYHAWEKLAITTRYYHGLRPFQTLLFTEDANDPGEEINYAKHRHWAIGLQYYID